MGFRGPRVQIPPSRLTRLSPATTYVCRTLFCLGMCLLLCLLGEETTSDHLTQFSRFTHDRKHRFVVRLLVAGQKRLYVLPAARCRHVLKRMMLSLSRPLPAVGVPQPAV